MITSVLASISINAAQVVKQHKSRLNEKIVKRTHSFRMGSLFVYVEKIMANMGLGIIGRRDIVFRRKFRWMFNIKGIVGQEDTTQSIKMLPPLKSARPSIAIKEMEVRHLDEVVYYPGKADWKTINLTLYHVQCDNNPIFDWLRTIYDPSPTHIQGNSDADPFKYALAENQDDSFIKRRAGCVLYDGCGEVMEEWIYECIWPTSIDWGELDMESSDIVYVDLTLRYARAYVNDATIFVGDVNPTPTINPIA